MDIQLNFYQMLLSKAFIYAVILKYFRVFDTKSAAIYLGSVIFAYFFLPPAGAIKAPEYFLAITFALVLAYSLVAWIRKSGVASVFQALKKNAYGTKNTLMVVFIFAYVLSQFPINAYAVVALILLAGFLFSHYKISIKNASAINLLLVLVIATHALAFGKTAYFIRSTVYSAAYFALYVLYNGMYEGMTYLCPISRLKEGMLPAERVVETKEGIKKMPLPTINPLQVIMGETMRMKEIAGPKRALTTEDIHALKFVCRKFNIRDVRIQRTVDMKYFVLGATIITCAISIS